MAPEAAPFAIGVTVVEPGGARTGSGRSGLPVTEPLDAHDGSPARAPGGGHQPRAPCRSVKVPVGPSAPMVAIATIASVPSVTVCGPEWPLKSVAV